MHHKHTHNTFMKISYFFLTEATGQNPMDEPLCVEHPYSSDKIQGMHMGNDGRANVC